MKALSCDISLLLNAVEGGQEPESPTSKAISRKKGIRKDVSHGEQQARTARTMVKTRTAGTTVSGAKGERGRPQKADARARAASESTKNEDLELVQRVKDGDALAYRDLVERYQKRAHAIALGIIGNYEDAEDIAQEAFLKAFRNIGSFRGQSSFYTWLYRIIFNLSIDLSRKSYRKSEMPTEDTSTLDLAARGSSKDPGTYLSRVAGPDEQLRRAEIRERFQKALDELTPEHRAVITLREIDGLSYAEISEVVDCSKGTVMSRLHHARKKLQKSLGDLMENDASEDEEESRVAARASIDPAA